MSEEFSQFRDMSVSLTPSKRQQDGTVVEPEGREKLQKLSESYSKNEQWKPSVGGAVFRFLCPVSKVNSVTGGDGSFTSEIEQKTHAKINIKELIPGCDERVMIISMDKETTINAAESENGDDGVDGLKDKKREQNGNTDYKESVTEENSKPEKGSLSLQTALLLVFNRMAEEESGTDGRSNYEKKSSTISVRILVPSIQVGCILGKGGCVIKGMASASGAQIRIVPKDKIPPCVPGCDELVQITGEVDAVRKALQSLSSLILRNPSNDSESFIANTMRTSSTIQGQPHSRLEGFPEFNRSGREPHDVDYHSIAAPIVPRFRDGGMPGRMKSAQEILSFRLLCPADRLGGLIGRGGLAIKTVQQDTGCDVKVLEAVSDFEDRVVVISGPVHPDDRISAVQDAFLRVQTRIARAGPESRELGVIARLLVSANQISCLLRKGGSIMAEMMKFSRAHICVLPKDLVPKCAFEDEVVQINGEFEAVQEALVQITTRLQHYFFRDAFTSFNVPPNPSFLDQPPYPPYLGRRELSPPRIFSSHGPSFLKFDTPGGFHPLDNRGPRDFHRFGGPTHLSDRRLWGSQGLVEGEFPGHQRRAAGFVGHRATITSTTVEVVVPSSVVPEIYGKDGECLSQIHEISEAKITIAEEAGAMETAITICGTPEQTFAAQSLIQAFVIIATKSI